MKLDVVLSQLLESISGTRAKDTVNRIARFHRIQASPGFDDALATVRSELEALSIATRVSEYPADGRTATFGWISPPGWRIDGGTLRQVEPEAADGLLCSFDEVPTSILGQSAGGAVEAELVHIGVGASPSDYEGIAIAGKFLLTSGRPSQWRKHIRGKGAAGIVLYPDSARASASYDLVQYMGLFPRAEDLEAGLLGFSISRREADRLLARLAEGPVRLRGEVDAAFIDHPMRTLDAWIPGSDPAAGEVLLAAHLCHPAQSANDNASGSGLLVEIARAVSSLAAEGRLRNTVRFLWIPEFSGAVPWVAEHAESLRNVRLSINLDMVGQSPETIGEPLRIFRIPNVHATAVNAFFEPILERIAEDERALAPEGSRRFLHWVFDRPTGGSDHLVFGAPPASIPSVMFGHDDRYWHTNLDTIDRVDPTRLKHVGLLTTMLATLPTWAEDEASTLGEWLLAFGCRELTRAATLARTLDPSLARPLLDAALDLEAARADDLASWIGDGSWSSNGHVDGLRAVHRSLSAALPEASTEPAAGPKPRRALAGPVRYDIADELTDDERAFVDRCLSAHHNAAVQSLANLCDGTRTARDIALRMTLEFGAPFSIDDARRGIEVLTRIGYLDAA